MNILTISGAVIFVVWFYILFLRPKVLAAFPKLAALELKLWQGSRQVLVGYTTSIGAIIIGVHDFVVQSGGDASTLLGEISKFLPPKYQPLALAATLFFSGIALSWLRKVTTGPVGSSVPPPSSAA